MKNIILIILVAIVPFSTIAQKRSKKGKKVKTEKIVDSSATYEFMIITGYEVALEKEVRDGVNRAINVDTKVKEMMKSNSRILINFDFGMVKANKISSLLGDSEKFRTMAAAVNAAANEGWDFVSSNIVLSGSSKIHYYYMKRDK
tara:strand:- start:164 stop:598 length:435 start_codon:yes stop_codon:yes gene_type:complete